MHFGESVAREGRATAAEAVYEEHLDVALTRENLAQMAPCMLADSDAADCADLVGRPVVRRGYYSHGMDSATLR